MYFKILAVLTAFFILGTSLLFAQQDRFNAEEYGFFGPVEKGKVEYYKAPKPGKTPKLSMTVDYKFNELLEIQEYTIEAELSYAFIEVEVDYVRDENGWVIEEITDDGDKKYTSIKFEYNEAGKLIEKKEYNREEDLTVTISYEYDERGNAVIIDVDYVARGKDYKKEYEYDDKDNVTKMRYSSTYYKETITYIYDENENVIEENFKSSYTDSKGKITNTTVNTFRKFDSEGNCLEAVEKDEDGKVLLTRKYEYDGDGNQISKKVFDSKNKMTSNSEWKEYDENGNWKEAYHYVKGKLSSYELRTIEYI